MKKYLASSLVLASLWIFGMMQIHALEGFWKKDPIVNTNPENALSTQRKVDEGDHIREWASHMTKNPIEGSVEGIIDQEKIDTHEGAVQATMKLIKIIINRSLGILGLIALIYLIYNGFMMLTAHGDLKQFDKGKSWIKTSIIAISWIGISRFIVSIILWIIIKLTDAT